MSATTDDDLLTIHNVATAEEARQNAVVAARVTANIRRKKTLDMLRNIGLVLAIPATMSGYIYRQYKPVIETRIDYIPIMQDGTVINALRFEQLDPATQADAAINSVVAYVRAREGYSSIGAGYAWNIVIGMSTEDVARVYKEQNTPTLKTSPWQRYGDHTRVDIAYDSHRELCNGDDCGPPGQPPGYEISYIRTVYANNVVTEQGRYYAQVRFTRGDENLEPRLISAVNAARIRVNYYVPGTPAGATPQGRVR